jgi:hypothetical protein
MNNEQQLYDEFDFISTHRHISWSDFLSIPIKVRRYLIGKIIKQIEDMQNHDK